MKKVIFVFVLCFLTSIAQADFTINRTMNESEMIASISARGLVGGARGSRGAKWVSTGEVYRVSTGSDYKIEFTMKETYRDSLLIGTFDYESIEREGEVGHPNSILIKHSETNAKGIGVNRIAGFNQNVKSLVVYEWAGGTTGWRLCRKAICR